MANYRVDKAIMSRQCSEVTYHFDKKQITVKFKDLAIHPKTIFECELFMAYLDLYPKEVKLISEPIRKKDREQLKTFVENIHYFSKECPTCHHSHSTYPNTGY